MVGPLPAVGCSNIEYPARVLSETIQKISESARNLLIDSRRSCCTSKRSGHRWENCWTTDPQVVIIEKTVEATLFSHLQLRSSCHCRQSLNKIRQFDAWWVVRQRRVDKNVLFEPTQDWYSVTSSFWRYTGWFLARCSNDLWYHEYDTFFPVLVPWLVVRSAMPHFGMGMSLYGGVIIGKELLPVGRCRTIGSILRKILFNKWSPLWVDTLSRCCVCMRCLLVHQAIRSSVIFCTIHTLYRCTNR